MLIDFNQKLKTLDGKDLKETGSDKILTLRSACANALINVMVDMEGKNIPGEEKARRYNLATEIYKDTDKPKEMKMEILVELKALVGQAYNTIVVGQVHNMLEGSKPKSVH